MTSIPMWEKFNIPVLTILSDGRVHSRRELCNEVADLVGLDEEQRAELLPSGGSRLDNRVGWVTSFLNRVDAIQRPSRGRYVIDTLGRELLATFPNGITENDLKRYAKPDDEWWVPKSGGSSPAVDVEVPETPLDPTEQVEQGITRIRNDVASELLDRLAGQEPAFFEHAVVELLLAMGYGGVNGRGAATALSHDGGIDGVIDQDVLGLNKVYVQAKRYGSGNTVQRPELQGFVGALSGKADAGVFITTSKFSAGAIEWATTAHTRLILIDGARLADLMIEYGVGVQEKQTYRVVEVDEDFFA